MCLAGNAVGSLQAARDAGRGPRGLTRTHADGTAEVASMKRPVFVVGCPRSGTTLLYSMLVAAGGFAFYRKETFFYDLAPRFPHLTSDRSREAFLNRFLGGYLGKVPGLDVVPIARKTIAQCTTTSEFLPRLMTAITEEQGMERWIEGTPVHVLYMDKIARAVPDALFVHVIRDGRDCALSTDRQGWAPTLPWDATRRVGVAALLWEWMVRSGRRYGRAHPSTYLEVRFEQLIDDPRAALAEVGRFIDHDLDVDRIAANPVHALKRPNTSFREEATGGFNPIGRWKSADADDIRLCDALIGSYLEELGYEGAVGSRSARGTLQARRMRATYFGMFETKHLLKAHTPVGRFMTSTRVWDEQPKAGETPVRPIAGATSPMRGSIG
jgi:hypothetical protein